jgi:hypothetical protein
MCGIRKLTTGSLATILWIAVVFMGSQTAGAQTNANSRSLYAQRGEFSSRTTDYKPAWKVHPKVRPQRTAPRDNGVRQARYQGEVISPPYSDDATTQDSGLPDDFESGLPMEEETPVQETPVIRAPATRQFEETPTPAPVRQAPARPAPRQNGGQRPTLAPAPPEEVMAPRGRSMEVLPTPRGTPRHVPHVQPEFQYDMTEEYAHPEEAYGEYSEGGYDEYGGEYEGDYSSSCPDCGQFGQACQCGPPHVCDDTWPCWHARRQWGRFRLFGGGWDVGCPWNWWDELSLFAGPHSFKGPIDQGQNGNFGIQEGINWGGPLWHLHGIGFQLGVQGVQSNFSGSNVDVFSDDNRNQVFATAGVFVRPPNNHGWQVGVVVDWMQDNYYVDVKLDQIRAELSYVTFCGTEIGGMMASSSTTDTDESTTDMYEVVDMYALFLRHCVPSGGEGRIWAGGTGDGNGLVGADYRVPLTNRLALQGVVNYIIAQDGASEEGLNQEAWGMTMNFVWHPFRPRCGTGNNGAYRPLFNVADNTMFIIDREAVE